MARISDTLKNLFGNTGTAVVYGSVLRHLSATRCEIRTDGGQVVSADHDQTETYQVDQRVVVSDGRIIGTGRIAGNIKMYEV